jgi:hypothetical protein
VIEHRGAGVELGEQLRDAGDPLVKHLSDRRVQVAMTPHRDARPELLERGARRARQLTEARVCSEDRELGVRDLERPADAEGILAGSADEASAKIAQHAAHREGGA